MDDCLLWKMTEGLYKGEGGGGGGGDHVLYFCFTNAPASIQIRWLVVSIRATYVHWSEVNCLTIS